MKIVLVIIVAILCILRLAGHTDAIYQAAAHLVCGGLIAACAVCIKDCRVWSMILRRNPPGMFHTSLTLVESKFAHRPAAWTYGILAAGMILVELLKFSKVL